VRWVALETTSSVAILSLFESNSLPKEKAVREMGDWFRTCLGMAKQAAMNSCKETVFFL